ncbi:pyridoxal phosphate-dependent aminotransferase [Halobacteriales archaeon QS_8_69_26]|nr:MAG: pyridoxal phosphate-dependent aminotransferase [Halobacteriales archaeon QS_8_69_26]
MEVKRLVRAADRDVVDLVSGRPDWDPPDALRAGLREYADSDPPEFQYSEERGLPALREEIAARRGVEEAGVVVTCGTVEANYLAMARALERDAGGAVLVPDPAYPYYPARARMLGAEVRRVPVGADGSLDPATVRDRADDDVAAITVTNPNNPTGAVYGEATVRELVRIAEECDAVLVSDEVYSHFDRSGRFTSAVTVDSAHRVVTTGVSKSMAATGLRIGYAVVPPGLRERTTMRHVLTTIAASRPAQHAVLRALRETPREYYAEARERTGRRADRLVAALTEGGADVVRPEGSVYVFARLPGVEGTLSGARRLVEGAGVAAMPGAAFGEVRRDWIRFALTSDRVGTAADRLSAFLADQ